MTEQESEERWALKTLTRKICEMKEMSVSEAARELGKAGGRARAKKLTAARRKEIGRMGAKARWRKKGGG